MPFLEHEKCLEGTWSRGGSSCLAPPSPSAPTTFRWTRLQLAGAITSPSSRELAQGFPRSPPRAESHTGVACPHVGDQRVLSCSPWVLTQHSAHTHCPRPCWDSASGLGICWKSSTSRTPRRSTSFRVPYTSLRLPDVEILAATQLPQDSDCDAPRVPMVCLHRHWTGKWPTSRISSLEAAS